MNKLVKGSIAGAAGIALLLGGAGTLAYWNDSATIAGAGTVTAGVLTVDSASAGSWVEVTDANAPIADIDSFLIVPGDTVSYTEDFTVTATGDNIKFTVTNNLAAAASTFTGATVTQSVVDTATSAAPAASLTAGTYTLRVTVTVAFPSSVSGLTDQGATLNLSNAAITVTQIP